MIHITKHKSQVIQRLCSNKTIMLHACNASPLGMHVNDEERKRGFAESEGLMIKVVDHCSAEAGFDTLHSSTAHDAFLTIFNAACDDISTRVIEQD